MHQLIVNSVLGVLVVTFSLGCNRTDAIRSSVTPPTGLVYQINPAVYTKGSAIIPNTPSNAGGVAASYSVSSALPAGLVLDTTTGVLSGTPAAASPITLYTVTASNSSGFTTATLTISVNNPVQTPGTWFPTGGLNTRRTNFAAGLLKNGNAIVVGGLSNSGGYLGSTEVYDPATASWVVTGSLNVARIEHTATVLPNGKVLVAGGSDPTPRGAGYSITEIYDPETRTWSITGNLTQPRFRHTATLLTNGKVLVTGGMDFSGGNALASAEVYDPLTGAWTATGNMWGARWLHQAVLLSDGKVLVVGGSNSHYSQYGINHQAGVLASAEIYDPNTGNWTQTGSMTTARQGHTTTILANGTVLVTGGQNATTYPWLSSCETFDPSRGIWTPTGSMATSRILHQATLLPNGKVLVEGGTFLDLNLATEKALTSSEIFDPSAGSWSATGSLTTAHSGHAAILLQNGRVLMMGGGALSPNTGCEIYLP